MTDRQTDRKIAASSVSWIKFGLFRFVISITNSGWRRRRVQFNKVKGKEIQNVRHDQRQIPGMSQASSRQTRRGRTTLWTDDYLKTRSTRINSMVKSNPGQGECLDCRLTLQVRVSIKTVNMNATVLASVLLCSLYTTSVFIGHMWI